MKYVVLFFRGNVEKGLSLLDHPLEQLIRDTCIFEIQEADFHQRMAEVCKKLRLRFGIPRQRQVEDWNGCERHCVDETESEEVRHRSCGEILVNMHKGPFIAAEFSARAARKGVRSV